MLHSDVFTAAVTLSGYFHTLRDSTTGELWGGSRVLKDLNDLEWRLRHLPPPPVSLLVTAAKDEAGSSGYADSRRFLVLAHAAAAPLRVDSLILDHGGHNFTTWNAELPRALSWLTQRLPAPPGRLSSSPAGAVDPQLGRDQPAGPAQVRQLQ